VASWQGRPLGVCGWARRSSGQPPRRAGMQGLPIPISHSSCAPSSPEGLEVRASPRRTCWRLGVVLVFLERQPPLPLVGSQPPLALGGNKTLDLARKACGSLLRLRTCPSLAAFWQVMCTMWGDASDTGFLDTLRSVWVVGASPQTWLP